MTSTTVATRFMVTRRGASVDSPFTDADALDIISGLKDNDFALDLVRKYNRYGLSNDQLTWVHILAVKASAPAPAPVALDGDIAAIYELFTRAAESLKFPKVRLRTADGDDVALSLNAKKGVLNVTDGRRFGSNIWYGKITPDGFVKSPRVSASALAPVIDLLAKFAADPEGVAAEYGRLTGNCSFCNLTLSDARSTAVGYGPTCAKKYGLAWGTSSS